MIAGDHGCPPEWRKVSLAGRDLRKGQDGAKRMDFSESEVSQLRTVQLLPAPSQVVPLLPLSSPSRSPPMAPTSSLTPSLCVTLHTSAFSSAPHFSSSDPHPSPAAGTSTASVEHRAGGAVLAVWPAALVQ